MVCFSKNGITISVGCLLFLDMAVDFLDQMYLVPRVLVSCGCYPDFSGKYQSKKLLSSVSTSLALAAALGIAETVALSLGSGMLMNIMGIPAVCQTLLIIDPYITLYCYYVSSCSNFF